MGKPNKIIYLQSLSNKSAGTEIGFCEGDKIHEKHFIVFKFAGIYTVLEKKRDPFKKTKSKSYGQRFFPRYKKPKSKIPKYPKLRCPLGKVVMRFQKGITDAEKHQHIDVYKCEGHLKQSGHRPHYVKLAYGILETKEKMRVLIVTFEKTK